MSHNKNRQPAKKYLLMLLDFSHEMNVAYTSFELANKSFEHILCLELKDGHGNTYFTVNHLQASEEHLLQMSSTLETLCKEMVDTSPDYIPFLQNLDLDGLGEKFHENGYHRSPKDWNAISSCLKEGGICGVTDLFMDNITNLRNLTSELRTNVQSCQNQVKEGTLHLGLLERGEINLVAEFARRDTVWASFEQKFLATRLLFSELMYQYNESNSDLNETSELYAVS